MPPPSLSIHNLQKLRLEDKLSLFILLAGLVRLVIFPADRFVALPAYDVPDNVSAGGHVSFHRLGGFDVDDGREEKGFAVLTTKVLGARVGVS